MPPVSRPVEADKDDSGAINLGAIQAAATAAEKAAAEKAKPASADLFADDEKAPKATKKPVVAAVAPLPAPKKGGNGAIAGVAIAVLGVAAAFFIMQSKKPAAPVPTQPAAEVKTSKVEAPVAKVEAPAAPTATAASTGKSIDDLPTAGSADPAKDPAKAVAVGPAPTGGGPGGPVATATAAASAKEAPGDKVAAKPAGSGKPGDLVSEMEKRVGKDGSAKGGGEEVVMGPANGPSNQNVPEQPSQGAIAAAKSSVMAGAKACVAGADDVSQATVTFGSNGTVSSVSVSGWAAANGASACVKAALKGAKVGAFSKPSYSFPVTIRP